MVLGESKLDSITFSVERSSAAMSSADSPSEASVGAAIWTPRASRRRTRIPPSSPSRRATKASAAGARRARGVSLAYPAGRAPVPKVTISRCSIPRPPRGVAADSNTSGGDVARLIMSVAAAARSRFAPASWYIDSASPRSAKASSAATTSAITDCNAFFSAVPKVGWPAPVGAGIAATTAPGVLVSTCASFHPSATSRCCAGLRRVVDGVNLERILSAKLEHHPVDLDPVDARRVVDAALQQISEQRAELLAVAHALGDGERATHCGRGQAGRERARALRPTCHRAHATPRAALPRYSPVAATAP